MNDILRYINDEDEEEGTTTQAEVAEGVEGDAAPAVVMAQPTTTQPTETKKQTPELDANAVDEKLQEASSGSNVVPITVNGGDADKDGSQTAAANIEATTAPDAEEVAAQAASETVSEAEKPKEPSSTPATKPEPFVAEPFVAEPAAPLKPMTWASRAAAAAGPRPVVPLPKTATPPAQNQSRAPAPATASATPAAATATSSVPAAPTAPAAVPAAEAQTKDASGWQTAGADSKRQNRPQSISGNITEKEGNLAYVKYVTEKVQDADLRSALTAHGELAYFDINRSKVRDMT